MHMCVCVYVISSVPTKPIFKKKNNSKIKGYVCIYTLMIL